MEIGILGEGGLQTGAMGAGIEQEEGIADAQTLGHRPKIGTGGIWNRHPRNPDSIGFILVCIERVMWRNIVTLIGMILE